ncbi:hypothetical protein [Flavisolibacter ginsenosidimutans]|uniref:Uncharacterized protein n=1 Tax=Flavisolibacter ginsenosidimutans TaxID=661481 RepID=A0A5B8UR07_9BACT|nr:hypothetical protein [Flavisolibacter ginsenosidimutans]QEC58365.1 hypothetical protein FSB75_21470 [Flavisolibacter ginsenosidimutans]
MKTIYQECAEIVKDLVGHDYLYFDTAIEVKTSPHSFPFSAWAVCVSPKDELFVMDSDEEWHRVELEDVNASLVIGSLYQRLKLMRIDYAKAS